MDKVDQCAGEPGDDRHSWSWCYLTFRAVVEVVWSPAPARLRDMVKRFDLAPRLDPNRSELQLKSSPANIAASSNARSTARNSS